MHGQALGVDKFSEVKRRCVPPGLRKAHLELLYLIRYSNVVLMCGWVYNRTKQSDGFVDHQPDSEDACLTCIVNLW